MFGPILGSYGLLLMLVVPSMGNPLDLQRRAKCNADNCARQVTGTAKPDRPQRLADCSTAVAITVIPAPTVVTVTSTLPAGAITPVQIPIPTDPVTIRGLGGDGSPPPYITMCGTGTTAASRYSSACSCYMSMTQPPITSPAVTVTSTVYTAAPAAPTCSTYILQAIGGAFDSQYFVDANGRETLNPNQVAATKYLYQDDGSFANPESLRAHLNGNTAQIGPLFFDPDYTSTGVFADLTCTIGLAGLTTCMTRRGTSDTFVTVGSNRIAFGPLANVISTNGATAFSVRAIMSC